ncbi:lysine-sensitive aspartokinase 3 [Thalassotalea aquiviva]|uniref:lysine-sensitive aspartokinase 3 n=1 Tax=Thalassotalea aquiviva TaxID=3242415 RepID=UPI00352AB734
MLNVAKFGGTSVADFDAMQRCVNIIKSQPQTKLVIVSASAGVTNHLVSLAQDLLDDIECQQIIERIRQIQYRIINRLPNQQELKKHIEQILTELQYLSKQQNTLQTAKNTDAILACGELMSSYLFSKVLQCHDLASICFDVRTVMRTNSVFGKANIDLSELSTLAKQYLIPLLDNKLNDKINNEADNNVVVTQGFIGADEQGSTTTLGRGGSDYSAALLAEACGATSLAIWTDVVGIFTTDPRIAPDAKAIKEISFGEAAEMATFGAKILHPATLIPAIRSAIPVFVGSSREPEAGGTQILQEVDSRPTYRSVALRKAQTLVTVKSPAMLHASGFMAKVFTILAKHQLSVDLITTSEISVALTFDNPAGSTQALITQTVVDELEQLCEVTVETGLSLIAVVGNDLHQSKGLGRDIFDHIEEVNIRLICHGASANNLCFLVPEEHAEDVVKTLHDKLFKH